jgi:hypothetical protein
MCRDTSGRRMLGANTIEMLSVSILFLSHRMLTCVG